MSMQMSLVAGPAEALERLAHDPIRFVSVTTGFPEDALTDSVEQLRDGLPEHFRHLVPTPAASDESENSVADFTPFPLDQDWDIVHWLLSDDRENDRGEVSFLFFGGEELDAEGDFGPPRLLGPDEVGRVATRLASIDPDSLGQGRVPPEGLYCCHPDEAEERVADAVDRIHGMTAFLKTAATQRRAVLIHMV